MARLVAASRAFSSAALPRDVDVMKLAAAPEVWDNLPSKPAPGSHPHSFTCASEIYSRRTTASGRPNLIAAAVKSCRRKVHRFAAEERRGGPRSCFKCFKNLARALGVAFRQYLSEP